MTKNAELSKIKIIIDACTIIGWFWLPKDLIRYFTTKLTLTDTKIEGKTGLIHTNKLSTPLNKINGVQVKQGLLGKIFNYGTICIVSASTEFNFDLIQNPDDFVKAVNEAVDNAS